MELSALRFFGVRAHGVKQKGQEGCHDRNSHQIDGCPSMCHSRINLRLFLPKLGERTPGMQTNKIYHASKWPGHLVKFARRMTAAAKLLSPNLVLEHENGTIMCAH
jgi:hypothetical protein